MARTIVAALFAAAESAPALAAKLRDRAARRSLTKDRSILILSKGKRRR